MNPYKAYNNKASFQTAVHKIFKSRKTALFIPFIDIPYYID